MKTYSGFARLAMERGIHGSSMGIDRATLPKILLSQGEKIKGKRHDINGRRRRVRIGLAGIMCLTTEVVPGYDKAHLRLAQAMAGKRGTSEHWHATDCRGLGGEWEARPRTVAARNTVELLPWLHCVELGLR